MSDSCQTIFSCADNHSYTFAFGTTNECKDEENPFIHSRHRYGVAVLRTEKNLTAGESPDFLHFFIGAILQKDVTGGAGAVFDDIIERKIK